MDHGDRLAQFGIAADPVLFDARQSFFIAFERGFDRRKQGLELGLAFFMGLGETLVGAGKELGLGGFEQAAANFAELGGQLVLGVLERGDLLFKGAGARLNVGPKRSEVAQRDFAFGLDGLQPIGSDGLDLVQSLGSGDVRLFMPGDVGGGLGDLVGREGVAGVGAAAWATRSFSTANSAMAELRWTVAVSSRAARSARSAARGAVERVRRIQPTIRPTRSARIRKRAARLSMKGPFWNETGT